MYQSINPSILRKAGDYILSDITLISYQTGDGSNPKKISIRDSVVEFNIYESIHNKCLSGDITVVDSLNVANHLPLTGFERIEFTFFTPSSNRGFNFSEKNGHPMFVYKIANRTETNPRTQAYTLFFTSKEMIRNEQTRCSQAFDTTFDNIILELFRNQNYLNSKKMITVEETRGTHKVVSPRVRPFEFINYLSKNSQSTQYENANFYFYETAAGFHFQSYESMLAMSGTVARPVVAKFVSKPTNLGADKNIIELMQVAEDVKVLSQYDTLKNLRNGVFASRLITHDLFNKKFEERDFDYHAQFKESFHTEHDGKGSKTSFKYAHPFFPMENNKFMSDNPEGTLYLQSTTTKVHNTNEPPPVENILQKSLSQKSTFQSMRIAMTVPGFTGLSCGDLIAYEMPSYEPSDKKDPLEIDPHMSGRYIVDSIKHTFNVGRDKHVMNLECVKDSVHTPYPIETIDTFTNRHTLKELEINAVKSKLDESLLTTTPRESNIFKR